MDTIILGPETLAAMDPSTRYLLLEQARKAAAGWRVQGFSETRITPTRTRFLVEWEMPG